MTIDQLQLNTFQNCQSHGYINMRLNNINDKTHNNYSSPHACVKGRTYVGLFCLDLHDFLDNNAISALEKYHLTNNSL